MNPLLGEAFDIAHTAPFSLTKNKAQHDYAERVHEIIQCAIGGDGNGHGQAFVEAETGVGKTLGYLIPVLLHLARTGERAVISTHSLHLQQQIMGPNGDMDKAVAIVEKLTGVRLTAAERVGKRNFVDADRCQKKMNSLSPHDMVDEPWKEFVEWAKNGSGDFREWFEDYESLPNNMDQEEVCITATSSTEALVRYVAYSEAARTADIVVTNHALLVHAAKFGIKLFHSMDDSRKIAVLVIDECDTVSSVAKSMTSSLLPLCELKEALQAWNSIVPSQVTSNALTSIDKLLDVLKHLAVNKLPNHEYIKFFSDLDPSDRADIIKNIKYLNKYLESLRAKKEITLPIERDIQKYARLLNEVLEDTDYFNGKYLALRWSPSLNYPSFRTFRLNPERILKALWSPWNERNEEEDTKNNRSAFKKIGFVPPVQANALILTSATISAPNAKTSSNFTEMKIGMGIYDPNNPCSHLHGSFSPAKFGDMSFVFPDPSAPFPFIKKENNSEIDENFVDTELNPEWINYTATMILAARKEGGRVLVHANSYRSTEAISDALRKMGVNPIEKTRERKPIDCIKDVLADENSIFVSPSAAEGLDLPSASRQFNLDGKSAFKHVIITQLPYSKPDDVVNVARRGYINYKFQSESYAKRIVYELSRSAALRKFKQQIGRGLRSHDAEMTLWVADPRFPSSNLLTRNNNTPARTCRKHEDFKFAIPYRFRAGLRNSFEKKGRMFLQDGRFVQG